MFTGDITTQLSEATRAGSHTFITSFTLGPYGALCSLRRFSRYGIYSPLRSVHSGETSESPWSYTDVDEERKNKPS